jgi:septum formation protein
MKRSPPKIVLASGSRYRSDLLRRIVSRFEIVETHVDETPADSEPGELLAPRLASAKARRAAADFPEALIIGADQVAQLDTTLLGKPGNATNARKQLRLCSDREVKFLTSVCVLTPGVPDQNHTDTTIVRFRHLTSQEIDRYVALDEPYGCAGSFKWEKSGISLFESIRTTDPTALTGLPLIWLSSALRSAGMPVP